MKVESSTLNSHPINFQPKMMHYSIYILRCWKDERADGVRFKLENPKTGRSHLFKSSEELYRFLAQQWDGVSPTENSIGDSDAKK